MGAPLRNPATYDDLLALDENLVGEILNGDLYAMPRPAKRHALAGSNLGGALFNPFKLGQGGPGGWLILDEPELHLGSDVMVPDLAAWRRERAPVIDDLAFFEVVPDWVCEILSPSTSRLDRAIKLPLYHHHGVHHVWLIDPIAQTLEVLERLASTWSLKHVFSADEHVRAVPFDAIVLSLAALWT
jgi:Uma2 family endonuclease